MDACINRLENAVPLVLERIKTILEKHDIDPFDVYFKIAIYRNYRYSNSDIYCEFKWTNTT